MSSPYGDTCKDPTPNLTSSFPSFSSCSVIARRRIVHRDMKAANLLVDENDVSEQAGGDPWRGWMMVGFRNNASDELRLVIGSRLDLETLKLSHMKRRLDRINYM